MTIVIQILCAYGNDKNYFIDCTSLSFTYLSAVLKWWAYCDSFCGDGMKNFRNTALVVSIFAIFLCLTIAAHVAAKDTSDQTSSETPKQDVLFDKPLDNATTKKIAPEDFFSAALPKIVYLKQRVIINGIGRLVMGKTFSNENATHSTFQSERIAILDKSRVIKWVNKKTLTVAIAVSKQQPEYLQNLYKEAVEEFQKIKDNVEKSTGIKLQLIDWDVESGEFINNDPYSVADITIHFASQWRNAQYRDHSVAMPDSINTLPTFYTNEIPFSMAGQRDNADDNINVQGIIVISSDYGIERSICNETKARVLPPMSEFIRNCLIAGLGLPHIANLENYSIAADMKLLSILYQPSITQGMSQEEAKPYVELLLEQGE